MRLCWTVTFRDDCCLSLFAQGYNNYGQLGDGTAIAKTVPASVQSSSSFSMVTTSATGTCAVPGRPLALPALVASPPAPPMMMRPNCWGSNSQGQWGDTTAAGSAYSVSPASTSIWKQLSVGTTYACGITNSTAELFCWGSNGNGMLGDGTATARYSPSQVAGQWTAVFASTSHTCGIMSNGSAYCWGETHTQTRLPLQPAAANDRTITQASTRTEVLATTLPPHALFRP